MPNPYFPESDEIGRAACQKDYYSKECLEWHKHRANEQKVKEQLTKNFSKLMDKKPLKKGPCQPSYLGNGCKFPSWNSKPKNRIEILEDRIDKLERQLKNR